MPVETIIRNRQNEYYTSLGQADAQGEATRFIEFMLQALYDTLADIQTEQVNVQVSDQVRRLLHVFAAGEKTATDLMRALGLRHAPTFRQNYLAPAMDSGFAERTQPDSPRSPTQRYRLTRQGKMILRRASSRGSGTEL